MKKLLLIYPPFCTPASPPYSITNIYSFLKANCKNQISILDLNLEFHKLKFPKFQTYFQKKEKENNWSDYKEVSKEYKLLSSKVYSENNNQVVNDKNPELIDELLEQIKKTNPDFVAFSLVYSSQAFYTVALLKELKKLGIKTIVGGPCVNSKVKENANFFLNSELELLSIIKENNNEDDNKSESNKEELNFDYITDFTKLKLKEYFTPHQVIPIKTCSSCYYKQCTFCTHHKNIKYQEYPLKNIKETIVASKQKYFFLIDDMISKKRLLEIAKEIKELNIKWACQLRPTKDLNKKTMQVLADSGLTMIIWGVESGNDRILNLIKKGTNSKDISQVLKDSHFAGIKNVTYILFGFPTETKEEFIDTIKFLETNTENIDLISTSVFGLQKETDIYEHPESFGITEINEEKRTILDSKITYEVESGLSQKQAMKLRNNYKKTLDKINKYPNEMNYFREHMMILD